MTCSRRPFDKSVTHLDIGKEENENGGFVGVRRAIVFLIAVVPFSAPAHAACSFSRSEYEKITAGMQVGGVEAILGCRGSYQGHDEASGTDFEYYVWDMGSAYVSMRFRDGSLTYKVQRGLR